MPGYTPKTSMYAPAPTTETKEMKDRFTGDIQLTIVQTVAVDGVVIVTTPQEVALIDARKAVAMFAKVNHLYRVQRGPENLFFLPSEGKTEHYCATGACGCGK